MSKRRRKHKPARLGSDWWRICLALAPSPGEVRAMLADLARVFPGPDLGNVLGVSQLSLRNWDKNTAPSAAARRAIWLVWVLVFHPARCRTVFDVATWGRFAVFTRPLRRSRSSSFGPLAEDWSI